MLNPTCTVACRVYHLQVVLGVLKPFIRFKHRFRELHAVRISGTLLGEGLNVHGGMLDW
jgi:hypothetical protein